MKKIIIITLVLIFITGCYPANDKATEIAQPPLQVLTEIPTLTATTVPSNTPSPEPTFTFTPEPSHTPTLQPTAEPNRYFETGASILFSYLPPEKWTKKPMVGKIIGWIGPDKAMLTFQDLGDSQSAQGASTYWTPLMMQMTQYEILSEGAFQTTTGLDAYKVTIQFTPDYDKKQRMAVYYYFQANGKLVQASMMRLWDSHPEIDSIIDTVMASFRIDIQ